MTRHTVKPKTVHDHPRYAEKRGDCSVCGKSVHVQWNGLSWRCMKGEEEKRRAEQAQKRAKAKKVSEAAKVRKRAVRATRTAKKKDSDALAYLWRQIIFERAHRKCEICGQGPFEKGDFRLQAHHLVKRSQSKRLQLDPSNGAALCPGCHLSADRDPIRCMAIVLKDDLGTIEYLLAERRNVTRPDPEFVRERLVETAKMLGIEIPEGVEVQ